MSKNIKEYVVNKIADEIADIEIFDAVFMKVFYKDQQEKSKDKFFKFIMSQIQIQAKNGFNHLIFSYYDWYNYYKKNFKDSSLYDANGSRIDKKYTLYEMEGRISKKQTRSELWNTIVNPTMKKLIDLKYAITFNRAKEAYFNHKGRDDLQDFYAISWGH